MTSFEGLITGDMVESVVAVVGDRATVTVVVLNVPSMLANEEIVVVDGLSLPGHLLTGIPAIIRNGVIIDPS